MPRTGKKAGRSGLIGWLTVGLTIAAVVRELRRPTDERTWHGRIAYVPYDFRPPTLARIRERLWAPDNKQLLVPHVFGLGWSVNFGRLAALVLNRRR
jgi:hypothetical protein